jgi:hypothetical protein
MLKTFSKRWNLPILWFQEIRKEKVKDLHMLNSKNLKIIKPHSTWEKDNYTEDHSKS